MADAALGMPRPRLSGRGRIGELVAVLGLGGMPVDGFGRHLMGQQRTRFLAETREVRFTGQQRFHQRHSLALRRPSFLA